MLQDLGSTFGPRKLNRKQWGATPVWADAASCTISMRSMPYDGATFVDAVISEAGRQRLADRLARLSRRQMESLFDGAAFPDDDRGGAGDWAAILEEKTRQIVERAPCPR